MSSSSSEGRAIRLLRLEDGKRLCLEPDALRALERNFRGPLSVVTLCGSARMGKSTRANFLVRGAKVPPASLMSAFQVSQTTTSETQGIWMYPHPVQVDGVDILVLDSEGLGQGDTSLHDKMLTISALISSIFVVMTQNSIQNPFFESLSLAAAKMTNILTNDHNLRDDWPMLLVYLTNANLQMEIQVFNPRTRAMERRPARDSTEYIEFRLNEDTRDQYTEMRSHIRQRFLAVDLLCEGPPDRADLDSLRSERLGSSSSSSPFFGEMEENLEKILKFAAEGPKKTLNQEWDGRKMGSFLRTVVESLNREKSVDLLTAAEQLQRQLSTDLVKKLSERISKRVMASMENALRQEDFGQQSSLDATVDREFQKAGDEYERMAVENLFSRAVSTEGTRMLSQECKALKETLQRGFQSKRMEVEKLQQKAEMEAQQKEMERKLEQFRKEAESAKQRVEERERELRMERERREREREERERDRARVQYALLPNFFSPEQMFSTLSVASPSSYSSPGSSSSSMRSYPGVHSGFSSSGQELFTGPRGGVFYINSKGNRSYVKRR